MFNFMGQNYATVSLNGPDFIERKHSETVGYRPGDSRDALEHFLDAMAWKNQAHRDAVRDQFLSGKNLREIDFLATIR